MTMEERVKTPRMSNSPRIFRARVQYGLSLEERGLNVAEVAERLGYNNSPAWSNAKTIYFAKWATAKETAKRNKPKIVTPAADPAPIAKPTQTCIELAPAIPSTLGARVAALLDISEGDLSAIVDLIISCKTNKGDQLK